MGSKRVGLARTQALIENLKRELNLQGTTLKGADTSGQANQVADAHGPGAISTEVAPKHYRYQTPDGTFVNTIELDLTGLKSYSDEGDVIGLDEVEGAHITKYVASTFGIIYKVEVSCIELPTAASNVCLDFDLISTPTATLKGNQAADGASNAQDVFASGGVFALGETKQHTGRSQPNADGDVIYLVTGNTHTGASVFTGGKLLIKFYGSPTF